MTKITIELSGSGVETTTDARGVTVAAPSPAGTSAAGTGSGGVPAGLLELAAAAGALNAGPAPSLTGATTGAAPVAASIGGTGEAGQPMPAGSAPEHLLGTHGGGQ
jgi:hypothetical protein